MNYNRKKNVNLCNTELHKKLIEMYNYTTVILY